IRHLPFDLLLGPSGDATKPVGVGTGIEQSARPTADTVSTVGFWTARKCGAMSAGAPDIKAASSNSFATALDRIQT
ncbi:hypothetical protein Ciccas_014550, partial [Cichlidogyrus casuarinus]